VAGTPRALVDSDARSGSQVAWRAGAHWREPPRAARRSSRHALFRLRAGGDAERRPVDADGSRDCEEPNPHRRVVTNAGSAARMEASLPLLHLKRRLDVRYSPNLAGERDRLVALSGRLHRSAERDDAVGRVDVNLADDIGVVQQGGFHARGDAEIVSSWLGLMRDGLTTTTRQHHRCSGWS